MYVLFQVTLSGYGDTIEDAWEDAVTAFDADPGAYNDYTIEEETMLIKDAIKELKGYLKDGDTHVAMLLWLPADVQTQAEAMDVTLTKNQINQVLGAVEAGHDRTEGVTWDTLEYHIKAVMEGE